jgi:hypothetical protein
VHPDGRGDRSRDEGCCIDRDVRYVEARGLCMTVGSTRGRTIDENGDRLALTPKQQCSTAPRGKWGSLCQYESLPGGSRFSAGDMERWGEWWCTSKGAAVERATIFS